SSGSNSTRSPTATWRTCSPLATTVAHASRLGPTAVAGMTSPAVDWRSAASCSGSTSSRSWSMRIGRVPGVVTVAGPASGVAEVLTGQRYATARSRRDRATVAAMTTRLEPGDKAPDFTLPTADGATVRLTDLAASTDKGVIVYFYPAAATPGCTKEACDFRDSEASLQAAGYAVVGISPDPVKKLEKFAADESLTFALASDEDHATLEAYGAWGEKPDYGKTYVGVISSTVEFNAELTTAEAFYNVRATGHVARVRKTLGLD